MRVSFALVLAIIVALSLLAGLALLHSGAPDNAFRRRTVPTLEAVRRDARDSQNYHQNWIHPGCGTGREVPEAAGKRFERAIEARPSYLADLLNDSDRTVRGTAALHIGYERIGGHEIALSRLVESDPDPRVREYCVVALGRLGKGADVLRKALADGEADVRSMALAALMAESESVDPAVRKRIEEESGFAVYRMSIFH